MRPEIIRQLIRGPLRQCLVGVGCNHHRDPRVAYVGEREPAGQRNADYPGPPFQLMNKEEGVRHGAL